jgi:hypothetical protein
VSLARDKSSEEERVLFYGRRHLLCAAPRKVRAFSRLGQWILLQLYELGDKTFIGLF